MTSRITRRELMRRGGLAAAAAGAGSLVTLDRLAVPVPAAGALRKCVSMGGPGTLRQDGHPDDYRIWGNREYLRDESSTTWVKLWVSWQELQQELGSAPSSRGSSWNHLNGAPGGQSWLRRLDGNLKAINDDGLGAILTVHHTYPTWSNGATGPDPVSGTKPAEQRLPLDLSTNGPWAWFVAYLLARYRRGSAPNATGPHEPAAGEDPALARFGNPDGAYIDALEICNEPNHLAWPQEGVATAAAEMLRSAESLSRSWGGTAILGPATSDFPEADRGNSLGLTGTGWLGFTSQVLAELGGFRPQVPVHWSHHNYREVRFSETPRRTDRVLRLLRARWPVRERQPLWLTEGGFNMGTSHLDPATREKQANLIERSFRRTMKVPEVFMWTQHTISDKQGNSWKGGLRDDFIWGGGIGPPRPAWYTWRDLPGSTLR